MLWICPSAPDLLGLVFQQLLSFLKQPADVADVVEGLRLAQGLVQLRQQVPRPRVRHFLDHLDRLEPGHLVLAPLEPGVLYRAASLRSGSRLPVAPLTRHLWH